MGHDRILVVGATGYIGKHIAKASAKLGHPTFALIRASAESDPSKADVLHSLKEAGVTFVHGDLNDHKSLVEALGKVDVVISAVGGPQLRDQVKLIEAIKHVGHIKRFIPSEFGNDARKSHVLPPVEFLFSAKTYVEDEVKAAGIPYTLVSSNSFAGYFVAGLTQHGVHSPPKDKAVIYGHAKAYFVDEDDIGTYTVKAAVDPRAENKTLYIRPAHNLYSHKELVELWEKKSGHHLHKTQLEEDDVLKLVEETPLPNNILLAIIYSIYVKGDQSSFEVPPHDVEATHLYPEVHYRTVDQYFDQFLH